MNLDLEGNIRPNANAVVVPHLNLFKAVKQQEKQVLAREIIEKDK
jgi:hypothetical protein